MIKNKFATRAMSALCLFALTGCASFRPNIDSDVPKTAERLMTTTDAGNDASLDIEVVQLGKSALIINREQHSEPVPKVMIKKLSITESSIYDAVQMLADEADLSLSVTGGTKALERYGAVSMHNLSGSLESVLEKTSRQIGFFWRVTDGMLVIEQEQKFLISLPPILVDDALAGMTNTMQHLGARDVFLDRSARTLAFRADRRALKDIEAYIKSIRESRSMIIFEINVWQVDLQDGSSKGIQWNKMIVDGTPNGVSGGLTLANSPPASSAGINLILNKGLFGLDFVVSFLETQGTVKTITAPRIATMNGSKGRLFVGNTLTYVNKIGTNFGAQLNSVTADTKELQTGVDLTVSGDFHDGTVYTQLSLDLSDLVSMNQFEASGVQLKLPVTTKRQLETLGRARPGDTILLGGITISRDTFNSSMSIPAIGRSADKSRSELVLAIRPKVVLFSSSATEAKQ